MRNLKKILALVLALVMSLSLMATAGAKDFADKSDIEATGYQTAVDVLAELEVIRGYENGSFQPNGDITRAEVAAIIYRIATKDVKDTQASIYTSWNKFTDVKDTAWYAGYVNYCANAKIVLGKTDTTFDPEARVTGYQVLAMILRTMGYGKNGEFYGNDWAINTAAQAKQIGIIDNVLEQKLGSPATRAMVAEILFRAMLTETVDYNALTGYQPNGKTLGQTQFGMEEITGVVMANEYADLEDEATLSAGKTRLNVDGKNYILNVTTDLTDIGESRAAYVRKSTQNSFDLLIDKLYDTGLNVRVENGDEQSNIKKLAKDEAGLDITGAEHFENFGYATVGESEWRIEYEVEFDNNKYYDKKTAQEWFEDKYEVSLKDAFYKEDGVTLKNNRLYKVNGDTYTRVIPMGDPITTEDIAIMRGIFSAASDANENQWKVGISGFVYAGTSKKADEHDLSSEMSWRAFYDEYIVNKTNTTISGTVNGEWLKIIDNDGDGMAEYVFKTTYCMTQVLSKNTRYDYFNFGYHDADNNDEVVTCINGAKAKINYIDEVEVGDVVLAALIDGKWQIEKAPEEIKVIKTVNYRADTVTTTEEDVYDQSGIDHHNDLDEDILAMSDKVEYTIYFDHFGHVGAYTTEADETNYALLSELYFTRDRNGKYLTNEQMVVEIKMGDADADEKVVSNDSSNEAGYFNGYGREYTEHGVWIDYLQRAVNHLGKHMSNVTVGTWPVITHKGAEFTYPTKSNDVTETNVAVYTYNEEKDTVAIYPATQYAENRSHEQLFYTEYNADGTRKADAQNDYGEKVNFKEYVDRYNLANGTAYTYDLDASKTGAMPWNLRMPVYAVDYIKLDVSEKIGSNKVRYDMDEADASWNEYGMYQGKYEGNYVNATHETEYYVVSRKGETITGIKWYKGYENLPNFDKGAVLAMYAVAVNTTAAADAADYWVADVIVIETTGTAADYDSVSLAYFNPVKNSDKVKYLDALDNMTENPEITLELPKEAWDGQWSDYGFYEVYGADVNDDVVTTNKIKPITEDFNGHKIYAGTVVRNTAVYDKGGYVMIDDGNGYQFETFVKGDVPVYGIVDYSEAGKWELFTMEPAELLTGEKIIYVYNNSKTAMKYIVVADFDGAKHGDNYCDNNDWTNGPAADLWQDIIDDQHKDPVKTYPVALTFKVTGKEEIVVTCDGETKTADSKNSVLRFEVKNPNHVTFTLKGDVTAFVPDAAYNVIKTYDADADEYTVTLTLKAAGIGASALEADAPKAVGTSYTKAAVKVVLDQVMGKKIGDGKGEVTAVDAEKAIAELLGIVANLVAPDATIDGADGKPVELKETIVTTVVDTKVEIVVAEILAENEDLSREQIIEAVQAAVADAVNDTLADPSADGASMEDISAAVDAAVEEAKDKVVADQKPEPEPETVTVTIRPSNAGIGVKDYELKDGVYTIEADTDMVIVLTVTSEEEIETGTKLVLTPALAANPPVELDVEVDGTNPKAGKVTIEIADLIDGETYTASIRKP